VDSTIILALTQDGIVNGAIFALLAVALVMVFAVTRVILIPQGEFVAFGALTFDQLRGGNAPGTASLLIVLGAAALLRDVIRLRAWPNGRWMLRRLCVDLAFPVLLTLAVRAIAPTKPDLLVTILLTCLMVAPLGGYIYRLAFEPLEQASVLTLLIAAMGVHLALTVLGLAFFGPDGSEAQPFSDASFDIGSVTIPAQSIVMVAAALATMAALFVFFERTTEGKALRAVAVNRTGARLCCIRTGNAGRIAFALAALIGAVTGVLTAPVTMVYYDSGFLIGLKAFVAAIVGGIASFPLAVVGSLAVGLIQSFAAFWSSAYVDAIVFMTLLPILLIRSVLAPGATDPE
jgi:branched-chain amino acid transport system permease protein